MPIIKLFQISRHTLLQVTVWCVLFYSPAYANNADLSAIYTQLKPILEKNVYGIPVYIHSMDENNTMTGSIYGVIHHPYSRLEESVTQASSWCDIAPQHLNIKACTYQVTDGYCQLTFYSGRKFYEKADDVYQLAYRFEIKQQDKDYIHISLSAAEGPAGTSQYHLDIEAIPINKTSSFIYFNYSYQYNFITSMGMGTYLATLGRGKVGFSITGKDDKGKPVYIDGVRGIIERNSVRYYLAIQSYLDTLHLTEDKRFEARINKWFDLTEKHHLQLHEMEKKEYLEYKHQEHKDQLRLQQLIPKNNLFEKICNPAKQKVKATE